MKVRLADGSIIRAKSLEIQLKDELALDTVSTSTHALPHINTPAPSKPKSSTQFKKITFKDNVRIKKGHRVARANTMEVHPDKNECLLKGNVVIKQSKKEKKQLPLITKGDQAILNLKTYHVALEGSSTTPVTTTIHLKQSNEQNQTPAAA